MGATTAGRAGRSPFVVDTRELGRRPGSQRRLARELSAPAGWSVELARVPPGATVRLEARLEAVMEGVLVTGTIEAPLVGECARCLEPVADALRVDVQQLYSYPDRAGFSGGAEGGEDDVGRLDGDLLDLEPALRDAVVLALPLAPRCRPDCAGLCPRCGTRLADAAGHVHEDAVDPRWAGLLALRADLARRLEEE